MKPWITQGSGPRPVRAAPMLEANDVVALEVAVTHFPRITGLIGSHSCSQKDPLWTWPRAIYSGDGVGGTERHVRHGRRGGERAGRVVVLGEVGVEGDVLAFPTGFRATDRRGQNRRRHGGADHRPRSRSEGRCRRPRRCRRRPAGTSSNPSVWAGHPTRRRPRNVRRRNGQFDVGVDFR